MNGVESSGVLNATELINLSVSDESSFIIRFLDAFENGVSVVPIPQSDLQSIEV